MCMTKTNLTARQLQLIETRAALRVKLGAEMGMSPFHREVIKEANAQLRRAGRL